MNYKQFMHALNQSGFTKIKDIMQRDKCNYHGKYFLIYTDGSFYLSQNGDTIASWNIDDVHDYPYENILKEINEIIKNQYLDL